MNVCSQHNDTQPSRRITTTTMINMQMGAGSYVEAACDLELEVAEIITWQERVGVRFDVKAAETRNFWIEALSKNQGYHYNRNAETYLNVRQAVGWAMVESLIAFS